MGSSLAKSVSLNAKKFNKLRDKLLVPSITSYLLMKVGFTVDYEETFEVQDWYYNHNTYTGETTINVATLDPVFEEKFLIASDITIGSVVYEINKRDSRAPDGNKPYWQILCTKTEFTFTPTGDPIPLGQFFWETWDW